MREVTYSTSLSDAEWAFIEPMLVKCSKRGRPREISPRAIVDAIFYMLRCGMPWRFLPAEFPHWKTVYHYFAAWRRDGRWEAVNAALRERLRTRLGRAPTPTAAIIDSQSVKTTECGGPRGYDGGKKINGRKRHLLVDTQGHVLRAKVHPADVHDRAGAELVLAGLAEPFPTIRLLWADTAYRGPKDWLLTTLGWTLSITKHWWTGVRGFWLAPGQEPPAIPVGFHVLPRRWVAERTFAWLGRNRRLAKDWERLCATAEAWIYLAMIRLMLQRLAKSAG